MLVRLKMSRKEHIEYQKKLCFLCLKKCESVPFTEKNRDLIIENIHPELKRDEEWLPKSLCQTLVQFHFLLFEALKNFVYLIFYRSK